MPVKADPAWSHEQDIREYEARFGKSDHPLRDTRMRLERNLADLHCVLTLGINYFLKKGSVCRLAPVSGLRLPEKVELLSELLPNSSDTDYVLRFTTTLAAILWLESERCRILAQRDRQPWLYPLYHLADCIATATSELEEALSCEHDDFDKDRLQDEEDEDGIPEEVDC